MMLNLFLLMIMLNLYASIPVMSPELLPRCEPVSEWGVEEVEINSEWIWITENEE